MSYPTLLPLNRELTPIGNAYLNFSSPRNDDQLEHNPRFRVVLDSHGDDYARALMYQAIANSEANEQRERERKEYRVALKKRLEKLMTPLRKLGEALGRTGSHEGGRN